MKDLLYPYLGICHDCTQTPLVRFVVDFLYNFMQGKEQHGKLVVL